MSSLLEWAKRQSPSLLLALFLPLSTSAAIIANWLCPWDVRFARAEINYWVTAGLFLAIPVPLIVAALTLRVLAARVACGLGAIAQAAPSFVCAYLVLIWGGDAKGDFDPSMERIEQLSEGRTTYRLYRTNCGATCSFGLLLQKEIDLPLGIKLVRPLWDQDRAYSGTVQRVRDTLQVVNDDIVLWELRR